MRADGARRGLQFYITAWLHTQKEPYSAIRIIFKKYPEFLRELCAAPERILPFPLQKFLSDKNQESRI